MAHASGTATNSADLLARLRTFLTTNVDLVADSQEWEVIAGLDTGTPVDMDFISFKGPGLAGDDEIFASFRLRNFPVSNYYNWEIYGHVSYNPSAPGVIQSGNHPAPVSMLLSNGSIPYWFFANGRCFKVVTRISGRYDAIYCGLILPDHTPLDWSLPLFIGGSSYAIDTAGATDDSFRHSNFWQPQAASTSVAAQTSAYLLNPAGNWRNVSNGYYSSGDNTERPLSEGTVIAPTNNYTLYRNVRRLLDGEPWISPLNLAQIGDGAGVNSGGAANAAAPDGGNWYGSLDGVFYTPSFGASAEEIITVGGVDHIVFPNISRTGDGMFAAFAME